MERVLILLKLNNTITEPIMNSLHELAIRKGGFDKENRKEIWMRLLEVKYTTDNNFIINQGKNVANLNECNMKDKNDVDKVLFLDIPRTRKKYISFPQKLFAQKSSDLFCLKQLNYHYYQGFLDIEYYIFKMFCNEHDKQCSAVFIGLNNFAEKFTKDYLTLNDSLQKIEKLLFRLIERLEPKFAQYVIENNIILIVCIGWPLTLLTHYIDDADIMNRILDYLLCSPPYVIYLLSICILKNIWIKEIKSGDEESELQTKIAQLDYETLDYDQLIIQTEVLMKGYQNRKIISEVLNEFKPYLPCICQYGNELYYPLMTTIDWNFHKRNPLIIRILELLVVVISLYLYYNYNLTRMN